MSHCIAIASGKGGVGKSAITANLGAALSQLGRKVILIDADIGLRSLDALLSLENNVVYDIIDVADGACELGEAVLTSEAYPNLFLLPAAQFRRAKALDPKQLRKILSLLRVFYDYILIDCPAGIERGLRNVLNAGVDETVLVVTPDDISVRSAERTAQVLEAKKVPRPLLVVNRLDPSLVRSGEMMSPLTISQVLDLQLLGVIPEDPSVYRAQLKHGLFVSYQCEARGAVLRIASRIRGADTPIRDFSRKKTGLHRKVHTVTLKEVTPLDDY